MTSSEDDYFEGESSFADESGEDASSNASSKIATKVESSLFDLMNKYYEKASKSRVCSDSN